MLRHSTKQLFITQRLIHLTRITYQSEIKSGNREQNKVAVRFYEIKDDALQRYNDIVGFTEIEAAYKKITELQEELHELQSQRTKMQLDLTNIRTDLANLQSEVHEHKRGTPNFLRLMKTEFDLIQSKSNLESQYEILDKNERELFSHLQARINILHDKSRTHTRQWGIISTIIGATLGIIGTSLSAFLRKNDLHNIQKNMQLQFQEQIEQISKDTQQQINQGFQKLLEHYEAMHKEQAVKEAIKKVKNQESWSSYLKRKTVFVWRWCTFQKTN